MPAIDPRNIEVVSDEIAALLREKTGRETLAQATAAHALARNLVEAGVRDQRPEWGEEEVRTEVIRRMHGDAVAALEIRCRNARAAGD